MIKIDFSSMANAAKVFADKHLPEIITGVGIVSSITAVVTAVKATPKAIEVINERKKELETDKLSTLETIKTSWKYYIPTAISACMTVACFVGADSVNHKRNSALAAAYAISETALKDYQDKVVETAGKKADKKAKDAVAQDKVSSTPIVENMIINTGHGDTLCFDPYSSRYFKSDINFIKSRINKLAQGMRNNVEPTITLNDVYFDLNMPDNIMGESFGWDIQWGIIDWDFSSTLTPDGQPCLVLDYKTRPRIIGNYIR